MNETLLCVRDTVPACEIGQLVLALRGRDAGRTFLIVGREDAGCVLIADGRTRRLASPKKKKPKHLRVVAVLSPDACKRLEEGELRDRMIRRILGAYASDEGEIANTVSE